MWYLAACNNDGKCFGFVTKDGNVTEDTEDLNKLKSFKTKKETNEIILQTNLSHMLLPNGSPYRVVAVKG